MKIIAISVLAGAAIKMAIPEALPKANAFIARKNTNIQFY